MLRGREVNDINQLRQQGLSLNQISRLTGFDPKTIRKYLREPGVPHYGPRAPRPTKLGPFKPYIDQRLQLGVWNAVVLLKEIQERGYDGGYTPLKDYLRPLRQAAYAVAVRRFETPPGKQAQVDWGHVGEVVLEPWERERGKGTGKGGAGREGGQALRLCHDAGLQSCPVC